MIVLIQRTETSLTDTAVVKKAEPFAFGDFTWVQGNNRQKSALLAGKYFTGGITLDCNYNYAFNKPIDHTNSGSTPLLEVMSLIFHISKLAAK